VPNDLLASLRSLPSVELYRRMLQIESDRAKLRALDAELLALDSRPWVPLPGPQQEAYDSPADELFFGGAAGPGKTQLLLGLAYTRHQRAIIDQSSQMIGVNGTYNAQDHIWRLRDGRRIEFGSVPHEWDVRKYQGRPHDLIGFDELPEFTRDQYRFLLGWNRTDDPQQRCRVAAAGNPPTTSEGRWVIEAWAPWLDPQFPFPAKLGALRWYTTLEGKTQWLENGEPFHHHGERIVPRSRTFIPARLSDNPILAATGYEATLQAMPEPLRSILLYGDFRAVMEDDPWQVIPTAWIEAAQARWVAGSQPGARLDAIGVDVARGGPAQTAIAKRYGSWFAPLIKVSGRQTTDGPSVAALVYQEYVPGCAINIDIGATAGGGAYESLRSYHDIVDPINPINNAQSVDMRDRSGKYRLVNVRAASYWKLRECLDPVHGENLALPPDSELLADLCAPRYKLTASGIQLEAKEDIVQRLGRSPDAADAVVLCNWWRGGPLNPHAFSGREMMSFRRQ
jgi:hypothetical protein